jgi:hypothetical protein
MYTTVGAGAPATLAADGGADLHRLFGTAVDRDRGGDAPLMRQSAESGLPGDGSDREQRGRDRLCLPCPVAISPPRGLW